ncbi:MAG TPA: methyltransferase domain-containing protein [Thermoanaerobaculia bacterium]|nr:methyltransferase domain-containing protein [Thermoanaerobaculia bacterium]
MMETSGASVWGPGALEEHDCPLCGSGRRGAERYRFPPFAVVRCPDCGLFYLSPRPPEERALEAYRDERYFQGRRDEGYRDYRAQEAALRATFRALLRRLERRGITGGSLLEVGCAYGYLLDEARPYFARREGVDFSAEALSEAAPRADRVGLGGLDSAAGGPYDLIVAVQVIEHVYRPRELVARATGLLRPGGRLLLATPDMGSVWRFLWGRRWPSFKVPEHVTFYDRRTLLRLLRDAGLESIRALPYPHAFPASLVAGALGLRVPAGLAGRSLWIPGTTVAMIGQRGAAEGEA